MVALVKSVVFYSVGVLLNKNLSKNLFFHSDGGFCKVKTYCLIVLVAFVK